MQANHVLLHNDNGSVTSFELIDATYCPISQTALGRLFQQIGSTARLPVLLAVIHHAGKSSVADARATLAHYSSNWTEGITIDFYEENYPKERRVFTHLCKVTKQKHLPELRSYAALFDPQEEALRVRHCLKLLTNKEDHEAWLGRILEQPITQATYHDLVMLASHLVYGYGNLQADLPQAISLLNELIAFRPEQSTPQVLWLVATIRSGWNKAQIAEKAPSNMPESRIDYMIRELKG